MKKAIIVILLFFVAGVVAVFAKDGKNAASKDFSSLDPQKQTKLELYLPAAEAYDRWKMDPDGIVILDVRTPEEYIFVGHPEMAWNVPLKIVTYENVDGNPTLVMKLTPDFVDRVKAIAKPTDTIFVMCRSGGRSAAAVNLLINEGFKDVYNIIDGFEGDAVKDPESSYQGKRFKNGWKNSGCPWVYEVKSEKMRLPGLLIRKPEKEEKE